MLQAFFDESGTHDESGAFVLAGLISPVEQWERLTREWQSVLARHDLQYFHTVDCAQRKRAFRGWTRDRCNSLYIKLVRIIKRRVAFRLWAVVPLQDFKAMLGDEGVGRLYWLCSVSCAMGLKHLSDQRGGRIPCTFERGGRGGGHALRHFELNADLYGLGVTQSAEKKLFPPLQAADVHAYELHKFFADMVAQKGAKPRMSFRQLVEIKEAGGHGCILDAKNMIRIGEMASRGELEVDLDRTSLNPRSIETARHRMKRVPVRTLIREVREQRDE
jgi:hypothetical protein